MKVIIADDERIVRIGLKTMIKWEDYGYELVGIAEDGKTALEMSRSLKPDIIITDLKMPKMDGLELLHHLAEQKYRGKVIVLSNYGEFELVREAMKSGASDYLLKVTLKTEDLLEALNKAANDLDQVYENQAENVKLQSAYRQHEENMKNNFLKDLLTGNGDQIENLQSRIEQHQTRCAEGSFFCLYISKTHLDKLEGKINNKDLFSFSIRNITSEMLNEWPGAEIVEIDFSTFMVIIPSHGPNVTEQKQLQVAGNVGRTLELYLNEELVVTVSSQYHGWSQLSEAYRMCREAAALAFYHEVGSPRIIAGFKPYFSVEWHHNNHYQLLAEAKKSLEQMDVLSLEELFQTVCASALKERIHPEQLISFAGNLIDLLLVKGVEEGVTADELSVFIHNKLRESQNVNQLIRNFSDAIETTCKQLDMPERKIWRKEILQVIDYMKHHAHEKITLGQIAREVNLNDSYLSRLFKLETGYNIIHYLNELRMERAVELMKDPNLKMKEIAEQVGIEDPFYFNRLFKKHYKMSPTEYKRCQLNF